MATTKMAKFANALKKGSLFIMSHIQVAPSILNQQGLLGVLEEREAWLDFVQVLGLKAFVEVVSAPSIRLGARIAVFNTGLGGQYTVCMVIDDLNRIGMKPNILLMGWKRNEENVSVDGFTLEEYVGLLADAVALGKSVGIVRGIANLQQWPRSQSMGAVRSYWSDIVHWVRVMARRPALVVDRKYLDMYPLFVSGDLATFSMVLQLGCVLHMVREWSVHQSFIQD
jgi:hypothetical protein